MVEMQGNCPHCGSELEAGAIFCAECGRRVAPEQPRTDANARPASAGAGSAEPAKPQNLARTMMGVQASSLFGNRSPGTPPAKASPPHGAFAPSGTSPQVGPAPSSFGGAAKDRAGAAAQGALGPAAAAVSGGNGKASGAKERPAAAADAEASAADAAAPEAAESASSAKAADEPDSDEAARAAAVDATDPAAAGPSVPTPAGPPLTAAAGAGAALGGKTLLGMEFGRDSNNVGAQLAAAVAAAKAAGPGMAATQAGFGPASAPAAAPAPAAGVTPAPAAGAAPAPAAAATPAPAAPPAATSGAAQFGSMAGTEAEAIAAERPRRPLAKTMLGLSPDAAALGLQRPDAAAAPAPSAPNAAPTPAPAAPAARGNANPMARTMLGMANPIAGQPQPDAAKPAEPKTIQGLPFAGLEPGAPPNPNERGGMARTMLGMAPISTGAAAPGPAAPAAPGGRTMLGVPPSERPAGAPPFEPHVPAPPSSPSPPSPDSRRITSVPPPKREIKALWPLVAATLLVVIATLVLYVRSPAPQVDVSAKIVSTETGEALLFEVPSAVEGSKIRFGGQEKPLAAGRASFALAADSLRVGDNLVLADIVKPTGETEPFRITLAVFYRIWVDTAALRAERSALDVVVTALPGTRVTLDGEDLKLDEAGRGTRTYPIDVVGEAKGGVIEHVVRYRVQPPAGDTVVDELRTRIPVAMMQIDRPGREVITDKESIEIAGAAGKDTQIRLDKTTIPVKDGRFLYRFMLPEPGEYKPRLVASAAGRAPLGITLVIKRVRDLNQAAAQFTPVQDLTYAKLAPNPAIYKGQKIELEGRIYAIDPRGADSVIQMFVRPCPSSRRCPLWVSDPHATDVGVDAWIRVLGTVQGEQQFRSEKNEIVTVPKVEAQFVLPAAP